MRTCQWEQGCSVVTAEASDFCLEHQVAGYQARAVHNIDFGGTKRRRTLNKLVEDALEAAGILFISQCADTRGLDFYLPVQGVYIEVLQVWSADPLLVRADNVIVLQGRVAVEFFCDCLRGFK